MLNLRVNDHDMAYIALGSGPPLVAIHGSLGDFRSWSPVMGPLSRHHRLIVPSLRRFFPEVWDGKGGGFTIPQHVADTVAFIEGLKLGPVHLMGHSRGGHIAFRVAQARPDLIKRLILAEPGGELDATLLPPGEPASGARLASIVAAAEMIAAGDVEGGLTHFVDRIDGPGGTRSRRLLGSLDLLKYSRVNRLKDDCIRRIAIIQPFERRIGRYSWRRVGPVLRFCTQPAVRRHAAGRADIHTHADGAQPLVEIGRRVAHLGQAAASKAALQEASRLLTKPGGSTHDADVRAVQQALQLP